MYTDRSMHCPRATTDNADSWAPSHLSVGFCHMAGIGLMSARNETWRIFNQRVEDRESTLTRQSVNQIRSVLGQT
jgi:hypothetical protein